LHARGHEFDSRHFQNIRVLVLRRYAEGLERGRERRRKQMLKKIRKDRRRREAVEKNWKKRIQRKMVADDMRRSKEKREEAKRSLVLEGGDRNKSRTRVRNRCVDTGNPRFVVRWFRRSGLRVRERALVGNLPGVYKVSW
jgi:small subunit ribosomal protein S14